MGLGSTAKKLQQVVDMAEDVYERLNQLRAQVVETQETVAETKSRVDDLESEVREQRAILEALAEAEGVDPETVTASAHITEAESAEDTSNESADEGTGEADDAAETTVEDGVDPERE